jgi:hypothetical protein
MFRLTIQCCRGFRISTSVLGRSLPCDPGLLGFEHGQSKFLTLHLCGNALAGHKKIIIERTMNTILSKARDGFSETYSG